MTLIEKKKLTDSIVLIREKTSNTLSSFYQYLDRLFKTDWLITHRVQPVWTSFKSNPPLCRSPNPLSLLPTTTNRPPQTTYLFLSLSSINWRDDMLLGWQIFFLKMHNHLLLKQTKIKRSCFLSKRKYLAARITYASTSSVQLFA